jgi:hypothetical protein
LIQNIGLIGLFQIVIVLTIIGYLIASVTQIHKSNRMILRTLEKILESINDMNKK